MASAAEATATQQQYLAQVAITAALVATLRNLGQSAAPSSDAFRAGLHAITEQFAEASASVARDYYQEARRAGGVTAPIRIAPVQMPPASLVDADLAWALRAQEDAKASVQSRIEASIQKAVADTGRQQVIEAVAGDELALGFRRVPRPDACSFCILMATRSTTREGLAANLRSGSNNNDRGITYAGPEHFGVYKSRSLASGTAFIREFAGDGTAKFHNNCHCVVEPVFSPVEKLAPWLEDMRRLYADTEKRDDTDTSLNAFRRAVYAKRNGSTPSAPIAPAAALPATSPQADTAALLARLADAMSPAA